MSIKDTSVKLIGKVVNAVTSSVSQTSVKKTDKIFSASDSIKFNCRTACAEGSVLLKNNNNILPVGTDRIISVFGRCQYDTFFVGYGSGGDVNAHYKISIIDGIKNNGTIKINKELDCVYKNWIKKNPVDNGFWGHWPMCYNEMPVSDALAKRAAEISDTAVVIIGRAAGEDRENTLTKGSYYLTENEEKMLYAVSRYFEKWTVILNIGGIFDFSWIEKYNVPSVLICWQGGMETGNAVADLICGKVSPSGKLTDTIASSYDKYPSALNFGNKNKNLYEEDIFVGYRYFETFDKNSVQFPFGYGLTYSQFDIALIDTEINEQNIKIRLSVKNTGNTVAKNTIQLYYSAYNTVLAMPEKILCGFYKTKNLSSGEEDSIEFSVNYASLAAYDDCGKTGYKSSWVLQKGEYSFYVGFDSEDLIKADTVIIKENKVISQLQERCAPVKSERLMRLTKLDNNGKTAKNYEPAPTKTLDTKELIKNNLPNELINSKPDCNFNDIINGTATLEEFAATLSAEELEAISRGDYVMNSPLGARGNAGVFGGVLKSLRDKGVPAITCTDGPSGIRICASASLLPNGTCLASTWNTELIENLYFYIAKEMKERKSDVLLAPGMNIHRNPLCGRNFEYFSEDPFLTGKTAAAVVKGLQKGGVSACPKHFACNNQEINRIHNNSVVSERALREIYLKGFEICVKEAKPQNIMTSYNKINGVWSHYNYELVTGILRNEWHYEGNVMTDWWMRSSASPEFPKLKNQAYRVRAGVDLLMPGGDRSGKRKPDGTLLKTLNEEDGITLGELQQTAIHILRFALDKEKEKKS